MHVLWDASKDLCSFWSDARTNKRTAQWEKSAIFFSSKLTFLNFVINFLTHQRPFQSIWLLKHFLIYLCVASLFMWFAEGFRGDISKPSPVKGAWIFTSPFKSPPILGHYVFSSITTALLLCSASINLLVSMGHVFYCFLHRDSVINQTANMGCRFSDGNSLRLGMWKHIWASFSNYGCLY